MSDHFLHWNMAIKSYLELGWHWYFVWWHNNRLTTTALLHSIEGGVLIGIKCKIRSRTFIWSPFDLIERIKLKMRCIFHKQIFCCPKKLWKVLFKTLNKCLSSFYHLLQKPILQTKFFYFVMIFQDQSCLWQMIETWFMLFFANF